MVLSNAVLLYQVLWFPGPLVTPLLPTFLPHALIQKCIESPN